MLNRKKSSFSNLLFNQNSMEKPGTLFCTQYSETFTEYEKKMRHEKR